MEDRKDFFQKMLDISKKCDIFSTVLKKKDEWVEMRNNFLSIYTYIKNRKLNRCQIKFS